MNDEDKVAERQVQAFLRELNTSYGLTDKDIRELFEDIEWIRDYRGRISKYGEHGVRTIMGAIVLGLAIAVWEGFKLILTK